MYTILHSSARSPGFYDSDDTSYYINPADWSRFKNHNIGVDSTTYAFSSSTRPSLKLQGSYPHIHLVDDTNNNSTHGAAISFVSGYNSGNRRWNMGTPANNAGYWSLGYYDSQHNPHYGNGENWSADAYTRLTVFTDRTQMRGAAHAPIFYEMNSTTYYADPASRSVFNTFSVRNNAGSVSAGSAQNIEIQNNGGTGDQNVAALSFHCAGHYAMHMHLRNDSYFGVGGWSASTWRWYVRMSTGDMTAAGNITAYSDVRLKEDITPLTNSLDTVTKLNGMRFKWKDMPDVVGNPNSYDYGILAHEVEAVAPEAVHESAHTSPDGDPYKTVAYDKLIPHLIEAIKELKTEIDTLKGAKHD
jgi:hypothetical protein